ncbi:hypothetical protein K8R66_04660, partial [bacterium]|nr:hypothetical protein [bacterium]
SSDPNYDSYSLTNITSTITDNDTTLGGSGGGVQISPPPTEGSGENEENIPMHETKSIGSLDSSGYNVSMYIESTVEFSAPVSSAGSAQSHSLKVINLDLLNNVVTVLIQSDPITLTLSLDEIKYVDLDNDGIDDLEVKFVDLVANRVEVTIKSLDIPIDQPVVDTYTLFKYQNDPKVYLLEDGKKRLIINEAVFLNKGYQWDQVRTIEESVIYPDGLDLQPTGASAYILIKYGDSSAVYLLENGKKRLIVNEGIFLDRGYHWDQVKTIGEGIIYPDGLDLQPIEPDAYILIKYKDGSTVYLLENGKKRLIVNEGIFLDRGYQWYQVRIIEESVIYPDGLDLN